MPTYDYVCDNCGHQFEEFQSISADALVKCPECKKRKLRRLIGAGAGILFKGSGFYETDYRSDSYKKDQKADGKSDSGSSDGKTDSGAKPAKSAGDKSSSKGSKTPSKKKDS